MEGITEFHLILEVTTQLIITASQLILHTKVFFDAQGAPWGGVDHIAPAHG